MSQDGMDKDIAIDWFLSGVSWDLEKAVGHRKLILYVPFL